MTALLSKYRGSLSQIDCPCYVAMKSTSRDSKHRQVRRKSTVVCIGSAYAADASRGGYSIIVPGKPELHSTVLVDVRSKRAATLIGINHVCENVLPEGDLRIILSDHGLIEDLNAINSWIWQSRNKSASSGRSLLNITLLRKIAAHGIQRRVFFTSKGHASKLEYCTFLAEWRLKGWIS